ncbi:carbohydrate ABC transporter permease [Cellulomonas sp. H30R-01]|uniref:carbohydrate ABC transporter permease n=1 Tax=Cellulomonas sp. H30R-01 TaxID=2704467 RepID=UPI00138C277B|nr:carbohydrate ABC transporter permease [Cellulomonas sp. H30R-01]QHT56721.1 carbohydrate ABC transporter permease [Cellulomonas sp. H30R-01]
MTTTTISTPAGRRASGPAEPAAPRSRRRRGHSSDQPRRSPLLSVLMLLALVYFLLPLFWLVVASTKSNADLFSSFGLWFAQSISLWENIQAVFTAQDGVYLLWMRNTVFYAGTAAVGAAFLATAAGYAFAKYRFPGSNAIFSGILGSIMIPTTALAIPTYLLFAKAGLTNTPWAVILPSLVSPFGVFLMRVYAADAVDDTLIEAARVDGAGELRIFFQVALRLLVPGLVTVLLFTLVATWNNYFLPLIVLNSPDLFPLTVGLAQWQATAAGGSGSRPLFSSVITGSLISIIPLIVAFLFLQRYWQSGLATGSVKG